MLLHCPRAVIRQAFGTPIYNGPWGASLTVKMTSSGSSYTGVHKVNDHRSLSHDKSLQRTYTPPTDQLNLLPKLVETTHILLSPI